MYLDIKCCIKIPRALSLVCQKYMTIKGVKSFQYFDLPLDETLQFNDHIEFLDKFTD